MINLTPHNLVIYRENTDPLTIPPSGEVARVSPIERHINIALNGITVVSRTFGEITGLPPVDPENIDRVYIVASLVLDRAPTRLDIAAPDTGSTAIRDENGRIAGITRLVMNDPTTL